MFAHVFICDYAALNHKFYCGSLCCTLSNGGGSRTLYFYKKDGDIQMKRNRKVLNFFATIETQVKVAFCKLKGFHQSDNKTSDNIMNIIFWVGYLLKLEMKTHSLYMLFYIRPVHVYNIYVILLQK